MHTLNPREVIFGNLTWQNVRSITIDRSAVREVLDFSDAGPYPTFADVPEQRVDITVVQELNAENGHTAPRPSQSAALSFNVAPSAADAQRLNVQTTAVVLSVTHKLEEKQAVRTIRLVAVSTAGSTDPITLYEV